MKGESVGKHRSRLQIVADILLVVKDGAKKTKIMRRANLSHRLLRRYLAHIMEAELVRPRDAGYYTLTLRGREFLNWCEEYLKRSRHLEEQFDEISSQRILLEKVCFNLGKVDDLRRNVLSSKHFDKQD